MSTSPIDVSSLLQSFGLSGASNINVNTIVSELMQANEEPLTNLQNSVTGYQTAISAYGTLLSSVSSLNSAVQALQNTTVGLTATSSQPGYFTATASSSATAGSTDINVSNIASAQSIYSTGFGSESSPVADLSESATQDLQIQSGDNTSIISITSANNTLSGLASSINSADVGVTATVVKQSSNFVVNDGTGSTIANNTLAFNDGTGSKTVSIAAGNYSGSDLAAAIQKALNTSEFGNNNTPSSEYSVSFDTDTNEFSIKNNSTDPLTVNWGSSTITPQQLGLSFNPGGTSDSTAMSAGGGSLTGNAVTGTYVLELASNSTGSANRITIKADESGTENFNESSADTDIFGLSAFAFDPTYNSADGTISSSNNIGSMNQSQAGMDAQLQVNNGVTIDRPGNTITDVIPGVTLNLLSGGEGTVSVAADSSSLSSNLSSFVTAYNSALSTINSLYEPASSSSTSSQQQNQGVLGGDSIVLGVQQSLTSIMNTQYGFSSNTLNNYLSSIGITTDSNGVMSLDSSTLSTAYNTGTGATDITNMINNFANQLSSSLSNAVNSAIPAETSDLQSRVTYDQNQETIVQQQLTLEQTSLTTEYTNLTNLVANENSISSYLTTETGLLTSNNPNGVE